MTLETLQKEMIAALKSGDKPRKQVIAGLVDAVKKAAIDKKCKDNIPESLVDETLLKCKKTAQEMIDTCPANRVEILEGYKARMTIIDEFAPKIENDPKVIKQMIAASGLEINKQNRGKIMGILKGKVDMKVANQIVSSMI